VFRRNPTIRTIAIALTVLAAITAAQADDVSKKWRVGLAVGGYNAQDEIESASANEMFTINPCARTLTCPSGAELVIRAFRDPRNDSQVFGNLDVNPAMLGTLSVQYGVNKIFVVEGSVGYQKGDVGDVEVAAQLPGAGAEEPTPAQPPDLLGGTRELVPSLTGGDRLTLSRDRDTDLFATQSQLERETKPFRRVFDTQ